MDVMSTKTKYQQKQIKVGPKMLTLYSLDGLTWSSRKNELDEIKARFEAKRVTFSKQEVEGDEIAVVPVVDPEIEGDHIPAIDADEDQRKPRRGRPPAGKVKLAAVPKPVPAKAPALKGRDEKSTKKPVSKSKATPKARVTSKPSAQKSKTQKAKKRAA